MGNRRTLVIVVAIVLALAAGLAAYFYVSGADKRAEEKVDLVDALVATAEIPKDTTGQQALDNGWVAFRKRTRESIPPNAVTVESDIASLVAPAAISKNQFITTDSFVAPQAARTGGSLVQQIEIVDPPPGVTAEGRQAVSVTLDAEKTVAGQVVPGDYVNVLYTGDAPDGGKFTRFLLTKVPVIGGAGGAEGAAGGAVIFSLLPGDVEVLLNAKQSGGTLWLTLIPDDYEFPANATENADRPGVGTPPGPVVGAPAP